MTVFSGNEIREVADGCSQKVVGRSNPGGVVSRKPKKKKRTNTNRSICDCYHNHQRYNIREQGFISSTACHAVYFFLIQSLIGLLQVKSQGKDDSDPFKAHPAKMGISLISICIYASAVLVKINVQMGHGSYTLICKNVILIFGILSPLSLLTVFVPNYLSWLVFTAWALLSTIVARKSYLSKTLPNQNKCNLSNTQHV